MEHLTSFRIMPNMLTMRPGDGNETAGCYYAAVQNAMAQVGPCGNGCGSSLPLARSCGSLSTSPPIARILPHPCSLTHCSPPRPPLLPPRPPQNSKGIKRPSTLVFSRQGMPNMDTTSIEGCLKGAYVVHGGDAKPDVILIGEQGGTHGRSQQWQVQLDL